MAFTPETQRAILQRMINGVVSRSDLTDLTQVGQFFRFLVAISRALAKAQQMGLALLDDTDLDKAVGVELDERAKIYGSIVVSRYQAAKATGQVRFSRTGTTGAVTIPIGTQIKVPASLSGSADLVFATTAVGTIPNGSSQSGLVNVTAAVAGSTYNVDPGTIVGFVTKPSGVDYVTNPASTTNGLDTETDVDYRERIKAHIRSLPRATVTALAGAVYGLEDLASGKIVRWVYVWENDEDLGKVIVYIDDGSGTAESTHAHAGQAVLTAVGGEVDIYLPDKPIKEEAGYTIYVNAAPVPAADFYFNPASGHIKLNASAYPTGLVAADAVTADYTHYTGLIELAQLVVDGDPADRATYPGYRAAGVLVQVKAPTIMSQTVVGNLTVLSGYDQATAIASAEAAVQRYINGLGIGEDVIRSELIERIMAVSGVYDVNLSEPTDNIMIAPHQLARTSGASITLT